MLRRILLVQLSAFLLLLIAFAILIAGSALAGVAGDSTAEGVLWWIAVAAMILAGVDLVAMVIVLAVRSLGSPPTEIE